MRVFEQTEQLCLFLWLIPTELYFANQIALLL